MSRAKQIRLHKERSGPDRQISVRGFPLWQTTTWWQTFAAVLLVGAGFGGIIGAVIGWILASTLVSVPVIGPVVGQGVLSTALVAMLAGVAGGALIGALRALSRAPMAADYAPVASTPESAAAAPLPILAVRHP